MCALLRATAVTTVYQRDSSSKRPRLSVVSAARVLSGIRDTTWRHGIQGFAPCGQRLRRPWTPRSPRGQRLMPSSSRLLAVSKPPSKDRGLTTSHSISAP